MYKATRDLIILAVIVMVWYLGLSYVPQIIGTCMDADCGFTTGEMLISIAIPLAFMGVPIGLEMGLHKKSFSAALSDIGLTRFSWTGIRLAMIFLLPLLAFYPLYALMTNTPLALKPNWTWLILSALINNGLAEETMMRGYVFRHLREGRGFWRAAALSTVYFAGYHFPIILTAGPLIGITGVILAIPIGFLTAYIYERGGNTVWGPGLLHAVYNGLIYIFLFPADQQPITSSLYMLLGTVVAALMLWWAYRSGYGRKPEVTFSEPSMANS